MKEKVVALASALVVMGTGGQAWAQSCDSAAKVTSDIWDEVDTFVKIYPCVTVVDCVVKKGSLLTDKLTSFWNAAAGNSWARIGPRKLPFGSTLEGTLVGTGGRMYISFPALIFFDISHILNILIFHKEGDITIRNKIVLNKFTF